MQRHENKNRYFVKFFKNKKSRKSYKEFNKLFYLFELNNGLLLPYDLKEYFKLLEHAKNEFEKDLFMFYSLDQFKSINAELAHWGGIPDYRNIVNTLEQSENCFVFADYMSHLFAYAIRLYANSNNNNEVYIICGDNHKKLANSFTEFLKLYFDDSENLKNI